MSFRIERNEITQVRHANGFVSTNWSAKKVAQFATVAECQDYIKLCSNPNEYVIINMDTHHVVGDVPYGC